MKFLFLSGSWQEKTMQYYRNSLSPENEVSLITEFLENSLPKGKNNRNI